MTDVTCVAVVVVRGFRHCSCPLFYDFGYYVRNRARIRWTFRFQLLYITQTVYLQIHINLI